MSDHARLAADDADRASAVALRYRAHADAAPKLVAKGEGLVAARIIELARAHGVPVREDPDLVRLLAACDLGEAIPPELYGVVAELLTYLYALNRRLGASAPAP